MGYNQDCWEPPASNGFSVLSIIPYHTSDPSASKGFESSTTETFSTEVENGELLLALCEMTAASLMDDARRDRCNDSHVGEDDTRCESRSVRQCDSEAQRIRIEHADSEASSKTCHLLCSEGDDSMEDPRRSLGGTLPAPPPARFVRKCKRI